MNPVMESEDSMTGHILIGDSQKQRLLNNAIYYYVLNLQGDVVRIVNTSGTTVASYTYNAYGKLLSTATTSVSNSATVAEKNPIRYRGYYYDNDIKLYYCQSRYYDPIIGRFLNPDAYALTGQGIFGGNMYAYCLNNPVNHIDSSGAFPWLIVFVAVCVIGGAIYGATTNRNFSDELRIQNETPRAPISQFTQPITQQSSNRVLPPYQVDTIPLPEQVVPSTANNSSAGVSKPNTFSAQKASEPLSVGDRICNTMIGASVGCMVAGSVLILGGAAACVAGAASVVVPIFGVTGQQAVAWGILSYNVFPVLTAPFLGMEMEVLEYPS